MASDDADESEPEISAIDDLGPAQSRAVAQTLKKLCHEVGRNRIRRKHAEQEAHRLLEENRLLVARAEGAEAAFREIAAGVSALKERR
jgi:hypothetical protein